jgi:predicted RNA-binding Zn-ribbon protein involved in translation (DUF1610 family)
MLRSGNTVEHAKVKNHRSWAVKVAKEENTMITCSDCGRLNEGKELGDSWICEDCKEGDQQLRDSPIQPIGD